MSLWICPLCGKQNSTRYYDPTDFVKDILMLQKRSLGRAKGFEEVERYSLLDGSDPELLELISDRVAVIYDMLYEDEEDDEAEDEVDFESLSELDKALLLEEEDEETENDDEDEDINDLDEEIIE